MQEASNLFSYEPDNSYDLEYEIIRNDQRIMVNVEINIDEHGSPWIERVTWGGTEFILDWDEESDILNEVEEGINKPDDEKEIDDD